VKRPVPARHLRAHHGPTPASTRGNPQPKAFGTNGSRTTKQSCGGCRSRVDTLSTAAALPSVHHHHIGIPRHPVIDIGGRRTPPVRTHEVHRCAAHRLVLDSTDPSYKPLYRTPPISTTASVTGGDLRSAPSTPLPGRRSRSWRRAQPTTRTSCCVRPTQGSFGCRVSSGVGTTSRGPSDRVRRVLAAYGEYRSHYLPGSSKRAWNRSSKRVRQDGDAAEPAPRSASAGCRARGPTWGGLR
jgi:hypothetical protein